MQNPWLRKTIKVIGLIGFSISIIAITFNILRDIYGPDQKKILERLKREFAKIDRLANTSIVSEHYITAIDKTSIEITYSTPCTDEEIQDYYDGELKRNGWVLVGQRKIYDWGRDLGGKVVTYNKLDLVVGIQYSGDRKGYGWAYSIYIKPKR
ncbi:MAG TPA: hypothetical protein VKT28_08100 [Puia sp.]|nr:hypothetical protein [Puia sp.]